LLQRAVAVSSIRRKGPIFPVNLLVFGGVAVLLLASLAFPDGIISKRNALARLAAAAVAAIFCYYAVLFQRRGNNWLLAVFAALVVGSEIVLRIVGTFGEPAPGQLDWRQPQPYFMFSGPENGPATMPASMGSDDRAALFNDNGFRIDEDVVIPKPENEFRVFVLGGSTVLLGSPLSNTIPGVIETDLRAGGLKQARVYNFGVVSFVSAQELALLVHRLVTLKPDLVIAYDGGNDLYEPWFYDPRPGYPFNFFVWEAALAPIQRPSTRTLADFVEDSALSRFLLDPKERQNRIRLRDLRHKVAYRSARWKREIVQAYTSNVVAMCRFSRANGILFASFFQPTLHYSLNLDARHKELAEGGGLNQDTGGQLTQGMLEERAGVRVAFANGIPPDEQDPGCRFNDLSDIFAQQGSEYYWDLIHVDNRGNRVIGSQIAKDLLAWDALRSRVAERVH
jgi:lysophospholipase L1-like esterase